MKLRSLLQAAAIGVLAVAAPAASAAAPASASAKADWTRTVAATPEGGFRMGNPNAPVKLVEYGSLTCPHCAEFAASSKDALAAHVRSGKVSFEYRSFVLNAIDVAANLVARCGGAASFFPVSQSMFAKQSEWVGKIVALPDAEKEKLSGLKQAELLGRISDLAGMPQLAAAHGVTPARTSKCIADPAALKTLAEMAQAASALGISGTPTFFINGARVEAHHWSELEPLLRKAGG